MGDRGTSPAIVVAALALVAALAGTALAGSDATTSAINKKKVKKIATKQINKLAPGLSVAEAANADTANNANALGGQPASAFATRASEPYREVGTPGQPQFQNGWENDNVGGTNTAFYKDPLGVVHLRGQGANSVTVAGSAMFTLPPAYRPSASYFFDLDSSEVAGVSVDPDGEVRPSCKVPAPPDPCHPSLDGITFRAGS